MKTLILDAGPLLSLSPLRGLADTYITTPQILGELRDNRAREHFERLGLTAGVKVDVQSPEPIYVAKVIQQAKKTGDYSVLSAADITILALTLQLHEKNAAETPLDFVSIKPEGPTVEITDLTTQENEIAAEEGAQIHEDEAGDDDAQREPLNVELEALTESQEEDTSPESTTPTSNSESLFDDPSDEDDGEGEWITPSNVGLHKSRALDLLPTPSDSKAAKQAISVGCMTADFAMQNVLLQLGLNLVSVDGKRIERVKSWVLRCHACFKICKDSSKKFCPTCGNATLIRASVTISAPNASKDSLVMQVHLKKNFQYRVRGTKYSIPSPKPGSSKTGSGEGLILREDQLEYVRAKKRADNKRERSEAKMLKGILSRSNNGDFGAAGVGSWNDPDWLPEMITVGSGGKGRSSRDEMPQIGYKGNPNTVRKKKK
ncbi:Nin one binding Zn-ribbon like-domain-containing protein [Flagelloscypha sp. PMI_526]|nr:Nin one binding Zn-ribbon like-domain-containing protein [Flagelloscypha sp. PMI_526]